MHSQQGQYRPGGTNWFLGETKISYDVTMTYGPPEGHSMDGRCVSSITFSEEGN